jgi:hypothetical protein
LIELGWEPRKLSHLDLPFFEEEVSAIIRMAPKEKAPEPDGFIGLFSSSWWDVVKGGIIRAIQFFYLMNQQDFHFLN